MTNFVPGKDGLLSLTMLGAFSGAASPAVERGPAPTRGLDLTNG